MVPPGSSPLKSYLPQIKVIGAGGGGGNVIARMIQSGMEGVQLIAANTDAQALQATRADHQLLLGRRTTGGHGAGSHPEKGADAARESEREIAEILHGAELVFIACGLGGGTGTGASPLIAQVARQRTGAQTVAVVTLPFSFEGKRRRNVAQKGLELLREQADVVLVIPNDRLLTLYPRTTSMIDAFQMADQVLVDSIQGISDLITHSGLINVDLSDVRTILEYKGGAVMGKGEAAGENRLIQATDKAVHNPLMNDIDLSGAQGVLAHIMGGADLGLVEVNEAMQGLTHLAGPDANIIFGATTQASLGDKVSVVLLVTGLEQAVL